MFTWCNHTYSGSGNVMQSETYICVYIYIPYIYLFVLQVLSHNLYTVLNIPHDPVALEEHFQDDDDGPVSNHGYMPYLNKYILDKVLH